MVNAEDSMHKFRLNKLISSVLVLGLILSLGLYIHNKKNSEQNVEMASLGTNALSSRGAIFSILKKQLRRSFEGLGKSSVRQKKNKNSDESKLRECANQICGEPANNRGYSQLEDILNDNERDVLSAETLKSLDVLIDLKIQDFFEPYDTYEKFKIGQELPFNENIMLMANALIYWKNYLQIVFENDDFNEIVELSGGDYNKALKEVNFLYEDFKNQYNDDEIALNAFNLYSLGYLKNIDLTGLLIKPGFSELLSSFGEGETEKDRLIFLANQVISNAAKVSRIIGLNTSEMKGHAVEILKNPEGAVVAEKVFVEDYLFSGFGLQMVEDKKFHPYLLKREGSFKEAYLKWVENKNFEVYETLRTRDSFREDLKNVVVKSCRENLNRSMKASNSILKNRKFELILNELRAEAESLVVFEDPALNLKFSEKIKKLSFSLPQEIQDLKELIPRSLKAETDYLGRDFEAPEEERNSETLGLLTIQNVIIEEYGDMDDAGVTGAAAHFFVEEITPNVCESYTPSTLSDHIYSITGAAKLSWSTVRFSAYGVGIAAHEAGHFVSRVMAELAEEFPGVGYGSLGEKILIWERRSCTNKFHGETEEKDAETQENNYTEEDWADYFGALLLKRLKPKYPWIRNFGCALMDVYEEGYDVDTYLDTEDTHSTEIFRLLHIEDNFQGLSQSCKNELENMSNYNCKAN